MIQAYVESDRRTGGFLAALSNVPANISSGARSNVGFFNPGSTDATVTLTARRASGATLGTATRVVPALTHQQVGFIELFPTLSATDQIYLSYSSTSALFMYASVVDNKSGDPVYVDPLLLANPSYLYPGKVQPRDPLTVGKKIDKDYLRRLRDSTPRVGTATMVTRDDGTREAVVTH